MTKQLSNRQCILLLMISIFALKFQGLFALISGELGKDGWLFLVSFLIIDLLLLFLAIRVIKMFPNKTLYELLKESVGAPITKTIFFMYAVFFVFKALIPFKGIDDLFGNVLFEYLKWSIFSILLVLTLLFIISKGLKGIARISEIFIWIIGIGIVGCIIISILIPSYERLLPVMDQPITNFLESGLKYNLWFGDYILLFMFMGKQKEKIKYKYVFGGYAVAGLIVIVLYAIFYSIYENIAPLQYQGLSSITQYALIKFDLGRIDKIFVLFSFISTIIATALYLFFSASCLSSVFSAKGNTLFTIIVLVALYIIDIFAFSDVTDIVSFYRNYVCYFSAFVHLFLTIFIFVVACCKKQYIKRDYKYRQMEIANV